MPPAQLLWVPARLVYSRDPVALRVDLDGRRAAAGAGVVGEPGQRRDAAGLGAADLVVGHDGRPAAVREHPVGVGVAGVDAVGGQVVPVCEITR